MIERLIRNEAPSLLDTDKANELIDAINAIKGSVGENGVEVDVNQNGSLRIAIRRGSPDAPKYRPFEVIDIGDDEVSINLGTINGIIPDNSVVSIGDGVEFIYLDVTCSATGVESISIETSSTAPDGIPFSENSLPNSFSYPIAIINGKKLQHQIADRNLFAEPIVAYEQPKEEIEIGDYPNDIYWTWRVYN